MGPWKQWLVFNELRILTLNEVINQWQRGSFSYTYLKMVPLLISRENAGLRCFYSTKKTLLLLKVEKEEKSVDNSKNKLNLCHSRNSRVEFQGGIPGHSFSRSPALMCFTCDNFVLSLLRVQNQSCQCCGAVVFVVTWWSRSTLSSLSVLMTDRRSVFIWINRSDEQAAAAVCEVFSRSRKRDNVTRETPDNSAR